MGLQRWTHCDATILNTQAFRCLSGYRNTRIDVRISRRRFYLPAAIVERSFAFSSKKKEKYKRVSDNVNRACLI